MRKDLGKIFSRTIITYTFLLLIVFIIKLIGLDYFGLDLSNPIILNVSKHLGSNWILRDLIYFSQLLFTEFLMLRLFCNTKDKKLTIIFILNIIPLYLFEISKLKLFGSFATLFEILYFIILCKIYNKDVKIKRIISFNVMLYLIQLISCLTRYRYSVEYVNNIIANLILNLDYIMILIIVYKLNFMKGDEKLCYQEDHSLFSHQQISLKKQLRKFQTNYSNLNKKEKFEFITIWILYLLWNIFTVLVILLIAKINGTVTECMIILSSFWINKCVFGKAFHMKNASQCFVVSNLTYYCLNRITAPIGISILVPILLGILLSYFTSKLVKRSECKLYRGIPREELHDILSKITNNKIDIRICELFYCDRYKLNKIAMMTNYSKESVNKHKREIIRKIEELQL